MDWLKSKRSKRFLFAQWLPQDCMPGLTLPVLNLTMVPAKHKDKMPDVHVEKRQHWTLSPLYPSLELMLSTTFSKSLNIYLSASSFNKLGGWYLPFSPHEIVCAEQMNSFMYIYSV